MSHVCAQFQRWRRRPAHDNRGIAMLLVLISVMTATIVTSAYLSSRDNSAEIGENVASAAAARWSARTGAQLTVRALQSQLDWRSIAASNGRLLDSAPIGDADVTVTLEDVAASSRPTPDTEHVDASIVARVDGLEQMSAIRAFVHATPIYTVDPSMREFAVFANSTIRMQRSSMIARWATSPVAERGYGMAIGTRSTASGSIVLSGSFAGASTAYMGPSAGPASISSSGGSTPIPLKQLGSTISLPEPPDPGDTTDGVFGPTMYLDGGSATVTDSSLRIEGAELRNGAHLTYAGTTHRTIRNDLRIERGSTMTIDGDATIIVFGNILVDDSSIELTPGSTLEMYVGNDVNVRAGYIGDEAGASEFDVTGSAIYMDPQRAMLMTIDSYNTGGTWRIEQTSVVKARIYATAATVDLSNYGAIYGCVTANAVLMDTRCGVFYDHMLDRRRGYTRQGHRLFMSDGTIGDAFLNLATFDDADMQAAADATNARILAFLPSRSDIEPDSDGDGDSDDDGLIGGVLGLLFGSEAETKYEADPLIVFVPIDYQITSIGVDVMENP